MHAPVFLIHKKGRAVHGKHLRLGKADECLLGDLPVQELNDELLRRIRFRRHLLEFDLRIGIPANESIASDHGSGGYQQCDDKRQQQSAQENAFHYDSTSNL